MTNIDNLNNAFSTSAHAVGWGIGISSSVRRPSPACLRIRLLNQPVLDTCVEDSANCEKSSRNIQNILDHGTQGLNNCSVMHAFTFIHSFIHSSIHSFIHSSIHSFIHSSIHSFQFFIRSFIHLWLRNSVFKTKDRRTK